MALFPGAMKLIYNLQIETFPLVFRGKAWAANILSLLSFKDCPNGKVRN